MKTNTINPPSKTLSAWQGKCPRCRKGEMFVKPLLSFSPMKVHRTCPHCGLLFEKEPGYFYAAMYVSYAFVVAQLIGFSILTYLVTKNNDSPWLYLAVVTAAIILLAPFNYRYSRIVLLYWMTPAYRFKEEYYLHGKGVHSTADKL